jgi:LysM repeat protein
MADPTPGTLYTVKSGDKLWTIAEKAYGSGKGAQYTWIFNANTNIDDPDVINAGQVFYIPINNPNLTLHSATVKAGKTLNIRTEPGNITNEVNVKRKVTGGNTVQFTEVTDKGLQVTLDGVTSSRWGRTPQGRFFWMGLTDWNGGKG